MAQPGAQDIDRFRLHFIQGVIDQERQKKRQKQREQRACFHQYMTESATFLQNGYIEWTCSKCNRTVQRRPTRQ